MKLLYVDDEPSHLWLFEKSFEKEYDVLTAHDGSEALEICQHNNDLGIILADQRMPGMSGVELMASLYDLNPDSVRILVTGYSDLEGVIEAVNTGHIFQYIAKPWDEKDMLAALRRAGQLYELTIKNRQLTEELTQRNQDLAADLKKRRQIEGALRQSKEHIQQLTRELLKAQENERHRIALDLHDKVAQDLSSLQLMVETMCTDVSQGTRSVASWREQILSVLKQSIEAVRDLSYTLRPPALAEFGLADPLRQYCEDVAENSNLLLDFQAQKEMPVGVPYETAINLYRFVQEVMHNISKHAEADHVRIDFFSEENRLCLLITDNGKGFNVDKIMRKAMSEKRMGLRSMEERIGMLHGLFSIESKPGKGTTIRAEVPV